MHYKISLIKLNLRIAANCNCSKIYMNFQSVSYKYVLQWEEDTISHSQAGFQGGHSIKQGMLQ